MTEKKKTQVILSKKAEKNLAEVPPDIREAFFDWVDLVEQDGLHEMRKVRGYRDEKLSGSDIWSCRLNKAYRLYYKTGPKNEVYVEVIVIGIDKHLYGK